MRTSKSDIIKYLFFIFLIILAIVTYVFYQKGTNKNEEAAAAKKQEETMNIAKDIRLGIAGFDTINPLISTNKNVQAISKLIYDPLITFDENYNINYALAKEISKKSNKEYIVKLREGVVWQNGTNFTANDVKYSIVQIKKLKNSLYYGNVSNISAVNIIDDHTLVIGLKNEIDAFEYNLTFPILCEKHFEGAKFTTAAKNMAPSGTGMYKIEGRGKKTIKLTKNPDYWGKDSGQNPIIETVTVNLYSNVGEVYTAFKNGNIDLMDTNLKNVKEYIGTLGYTAATYKTKEFDYLVFNCRSGCLSDSSARKAINLAIDTASIVKAVYGVNYSTSSFPLDYGSWLCSVAQPDSAFDQNRAKQALRDGGWQYAAGNWSKTISGERVNLDFEITVNDSNAIDIEVAYRIANQLSKVGIKCGVKETAKKKYYDLLGKKNGYEAMIVNINTSNSINMNTFLGNKNTSGYVSARMTELLKRFYNSSDTNTMKEMYSQIISLYNEDVPFVGIARKNGVVIYNTNVVGTTKPTSYSIFNKFQKWYRKNY